MLRLSLTTFREHRRLFAGAIVAVALGVALLQSSLLVMAAIADAKIPPALSGQARERLRDSYAGAATLLGMTVLLAAFLALFIVSSTFAFTVAQRRRELALLRLAGGSRPQLLGLLLSEALLLGTAGTATGVLVGVPATWAQSWSLVALGFLPGGFSPHLDGGIMLGSACAGLGVALLGVLAAARRAAAVRPLEALRDTGRAARVMTVSRWFFGTSSLAVTVWMVWVGQASEVLGAIVIALGVSVIGAVALSLLSPLAVPLASRLLGPALRSSTLGELAQANLRDAVRRSASTAAPLIVLVALVLGLTGTLDSLAAMVGEEQQRIVAGDLVADSTGAVAARIAQVPGVAVASVQSTVPISVTGRHRRAGRTFRRTLYSGIVAVDPSSYRRTHRPAPRAGSLDRLHGRTIAVAPGQSEEGWRLGGTVTARVGGQRMRLRIVALLPPTLENGADNFLVPRELIPDAIAARAPAQTVIQVAPGTDPAAVAGRLRAAGVGTVRTLARWADDRAAAEERANMAIFAVLMGLGGLYAAVAVVNAVVIAGAERTAEFAVARVTGLSRSQVVRMALIEASAVTAIGLALGGLVAAGALAGIGAAGVRAVGVPLVAVPWTPLLLLVPGAFLVTGATSVWSTLSATRRQPVTLVTARE
ncbi:FtsX-like permease family protein [Actinoallomurus iriomotensis]|uniref:ABC transporter permease n=1 Tax=Actinoallomurus iriomotensis TaxID=478107 RepID=A0A9W6S2L0_9ACTN|nr:ABC transporter permease [Actinoallomurus iriomotensis]GLY87401.1 ABC transporter permease [Actinoallomurus iriomotensis]